MITLEENKKCPIYLASEKKFSHKIMSDESKKMSRILGWLSGGFLLFAAVNAFILKPVVRSEVEPINSKLEALQISVEAVNETIGNHLNQDHNFTPSNAQFKDE